MQNTLTTESLQQPPPQTGTPRDWISSFRQAIQLHLDQQEEALVSAWETRIAEMQANEAALQLENQRLRQQIKDGEFELQATVDEYNRIHGELELARQEAEQANAVKSMFLASMSHELRTPLNAILNFSQFVSSGMLGSVNQEQIDMLEKITSSGTHLLNLINDVLDISKIEAGSLRLFVEKDVCLEDEIHTVAATAEALLKEKPVALKLELEPDVPLLVGDRRRVRQLLLNLVSNACKFTENGSITIALERQEQDIVISVRDTGPGIPSQELEAVFEAFRQTQAGLRLGSGTGLGLAISRRLAQAHGGQLVLESEEGVGSTFIVTLPSQYPALLQLLKESSGDR